MLFVYSRQTICMAFLTWTLRPISMATTTVGCAGYDLASFCGSHVFPFGMASIVGLLFSTMSHLAATPLRTYAHVWSTAEHVCKRPRGAFLAGVFFSQLSRPTEHAPLLFDCSTLVAALSALFIFLLSIVETLPRNIRMSSFLPWLLCLTLPVLIPLLFDISVVFYLARSRLLPLLTPAWI